jgi:hypothetical protein
MASTVEEYLRASATTQEAASLRDFGDKPLAVLTASVGHDAAWMTAQNKTAALSTNSVHRVIAGATHEALVAEKKYAAATTRAILDVVNSVRHGAAEPHRGEHDQSKLHEHPGTHSS